MRQLEPLTWKIAADGERRLRSWVYWIYGLLVASFLGAFLDLSPFLLSNEGLGMWHSIFVLAAVCIGLWSAVVFAIECNPWKVVTEHKWKWYYPFRLLILATPLLCGMMMATGFLRLTTDYLPRMANHSIGEPARIEVEVTKIERKRQCSRQRCLRKLFGMPEHMYVVTLKGYRSSHTRSLEYERYPSGYMELLPPNRRADPPILSEFSGRQSWFGMHVVSMRPVLSRVSELHE